MFYNLNKQFILGLNQRFYINFDVLYKQVKVGVLIKPLPKLKIRSTKQPIGYNSCNYYNSYINSFIGYNTIMIALIIVFGQ